MRLSTILRMKNNIEKVQDYFVYTTTSENKESIIISRRNYAQRIYLEDGTELDVSGTGVLKHTFQEVGEHKVWIEFKKDLTSFYDCFSFCKDLTSIPENIFLNHNNITNFYNCFNYCSGLKTIPNNLFKNCSEATDFLYCFYGCTNLTSSCPIDNDGTPIYNRSGKGKDGYAIVSSYKSCFRKCTNMADYDSIPTDWK